METTTKVNSCFNLGQIFQIAQKSADHIRKAATPKKTVFEVLNENLTAEEMKVVGKFLTVNKASQFSNGIKSALTSMFDWNRTAPSVNRDYWANIYSRFERGND